jgi:hypothetical protein
MKQIAQKSNKGDGNGDGDPFDEWHLKKEKGNRCTSTTLQHDLQHVT